MADEPRPEDQPAPSGDDIVLLNDDPTKILGRKASDPPPPPEAAGDDIVLLSDDPTKVFGRKLPTSAEVAAGASAAPPPAPAQWSAPDRETSTPASWTKPEEPKPQAEAGFEASLYEAGPAVTGEVVTGEPAGAPSDTTAFGGSEPAEMQKPVDLRQVAPVAAVSPWERPTGGSKWPLVAALLLLLLAGGGFGAWWKFWRKADDAVTPAVAQKPPVTKPPVDPVKPPVDPVKPPVDPVKPPVDPVKPPVDPVKPPVDPVKPPVDLDGEGTVPDWLKSEKMPKDPKAAAALILKKIPTNTPCVVELTNGNYMQGRLIENTATQIRLAMKEGAEGRIVVEKSEVAAIFPMGELGYYYYRGYRRGYVILTSGRRVTGAILRESPTDVVIGLQEDGNVRYERKEIRELVVTSDVR